NHYGQTNIEAQLAMPTSLLHWVRGMLEVRKAHPVFGNGDYVPLDSDNEAVLAFLRRNSTETMLCVTNLANTPRSATITVPELGGHGLVDVFSGTRFPTLTPVPAQPPGQAPGAAPEVEEESVVRHHTPE